jgi:ElaB/YqjD/DUF883 family membrane-anchored ribosome-binding protein
MFDREETPGNAWHALSKFIPPGKFHRERTHMKHKRNKNTMQNQTSDLADDAQSLVAATANATEQKIIDARDRLSAAIESARETCDRLQQKAVEGAQSVDKQIREHPYQAIGMAFGIGALVGCLIGRRNGN